MKIVTYKGIGYYSTGNGYLLDKETHEKIYKSLGNGIYEKIGNSVETVANEAQDGDQAVDQKVEYPENEGKKNTPWPNFSKRKNIDTRA